MVQSNKKDFSGQNISIGIDVHLRTCTGGKTMRKWEG